MTDTAAPHVLVIEGPCQQIDPDTGEHYCAEDGDRCDYRWSIECPGVTRACEMFLACLECVSPDEQTTHALGEGEPVHGVEHDRIHGLGWATPTGRCYVQAADTTGDAVYELDLPPGQYLVGHDYGEPDEITLYVIEPASVAS